MSASKMKTPGCFRLHSKPEIGSEQKSGVKLGEQVWFGTPISRTQGVGVVPTGSTGEDSSRTPDLGEGAVGVQTGNYLSFTTLGLSFSSTGSPRRPTSNSGVHCRPL